mgnify:CR=1 FL=1
MRGGVVEDQDIETVGIVTAEVLQEGLKTAAIQGGHFQPEGVPGGGFHGGVEPVGLVEGRIGLEGLDPASGEAARLREMESETAFVLKEDPEWRGPRFTA